MRRLATRTVRCNALAVPVHAPTSDSRTSDPRPHNFIFDCVHGHCKLLPSPPHRIARLRSQGNMIQGCISAKRRLPTTRISSPLSILFVMIIIGMSPNTCSGTSQHISNLTLILILTNAHCLGALKGKQNTTFMQGR